MSSFLMVFALVAIASLVIFSVQQDIPKTTDIDLKKFTSDKEFRAFVNEGGDYRSYNQMFGGEAMTMAESLDSSSASPQKSFADDYSTTNIQVKGVDEADIVKNDGKYIYVATGKKVVILDAYPADKMNILSEIDFNGNVNKIFINENKLVVFGNGIIDSPRDEETKDKEIRAIKEEYYPRNYDPAVLTYDIRNRENPVLENTVILEGNYIDSRMIGDYIYIVSNKYVHAGVEPPIYFVNGVEQAVVAEDIYYPTFRDDNYQLKLKSSSPLIFSTSPDFFILKSLNHLF